MLSALRFLVFPFQTSEINEKQSDQGYCEHKTISVSWYEIQLTSGWSDYQGQNESAWWLNPAYLTSEIGLEDVAKNNNKQQVTTHIAFVCTLRWLAWRQFEQQ